MLSGSGGYFMVVVAILCKWWSTPTSVDHCGHIPVSDMHYVFVFVHVNALSMPFYDNK